MIVSITPFRVSLFGGTSDMPAYYREHGGEVLGFAINHFCRISLRRLPPFFGYRHRIVHSLIELATGVDEIQHPVVRELLRMDGIECGLSIHHDGDLPAKSGLGSSSSFTVGMLNALHAFKGMMAPKQVLAKEAITLEREILKENVGSQDQIWAAYGGFNHIRFFMDDQFEVIPVIIPPERKRELTSHLMLLFTGLSRFSSEIAGEVLANMRERQEAVGRMRALVPEALGVLQSTAPISEIGRMLHEGWTLKRGLGASVSTPLVDEIYSVARDAGALGGKLLGAGGGGFMVLFAPPHAQPKIKDRLSSFVHVPFNIEMEGSKIVTYEPEGV